MRVNKKVCPVSEFNADLSAAMAHDFGYHFAPQHVDSSFGLLVKIHPSSLISPDRDRPHKTVDSERAAKRPCRSRAERHGAQLLHAHIRNKSEQSDKTAAATARLLLGRTSRAK